MVPPSLSWRPTSLFNLPPPESLRARRVLGGQTPPPPESFRTRRGLGPGGQTPAFPLLGVRKSGTRTRRHRNVALFLEADAAQRIIAVVVRCHLRLHLASSSRRTNFPGRRSAGRPIRSRWTIASSELRWHLGDEYLPSHLPYYWASQHDTRHITRHALCSRCASSCA